MNRNGQTLFWAVVIGIMIVAAGMLFLNFVKPEVDNARASDALDCSNLTISDGAKLTCLGADAAVPYFIIVVLAAAGGYITSKFI